jgi:hypothetical protein
MRGRPLATPERIREVVDYDQDTGLFTRKLAKVGFPVGRQMGSINRDGYSIFMIDYRLYAAHRVAWVWMTGRWPTHQVDHINGQRADNRWVNLREATQSQNLMNCKRQSRNTSGYKGVFLDNGRWRSVIQFEKKTKYLGSYSTPQEAHEAYCKAAREQCGAFARTA